MDNIGKKERHVPPFSCWGRGGFRPHSEPILLLPLLLLLLLSLKPGHSPPRASLAKFPNTFEIPFLVPSLPSLSANPQKETVAPEGYMTCPQGSSGYICKHIMGFPRKASQAEATRNTETRGRVCSGSWERLGRPDPRG